MRTFAIILLGLGLFNAAADAAKGSCRAARKCCDGKDGGCLINAIDYHSKATEPCYCDHGCIQMGDCCPDFKDYCGVIDCRVGDWSSWSDCSVSCGPGGVSTRRRVVEHPASNGGDECPLLEETVSCAGERCESVRRRQDDADADDADADDYDDDGDNEIDDERAISAPRETAMLLPGKYAQQVPRSGRSYDVRENLKSYRRVDESNKYCVVFEVDKAMKSCQKSPETEHLKRGNRVCSLCDVKAQREDLGGRCSGHGADQRRTRFKNLMNPRCHGKWTRVAVKGACPCAAGPDYIFV